jgi:hypothetical protein
LGTEEKERFQVEFDQGISQNFTKKALLPLWKQKRQIKFSILTVYWQKLMPLNDFSCLFNKANKNEITEIK